MNIEVDNILHPVLVDGTISDIHIPRMIIPRICSISYGVLHREVSPRRT